MNISDLQKMGNEEGAYRENLERLKSEEEISVKKKSPLELEMESSIDKTIESAKKTYWTDDTEAAVVEFLALDENFYSQRIKEEIDNAKKAKPSRKPDEKYIDRMAKMRAELLLDESRIEERDKVFRERIRKPFNRLVENIIFNYKLFRPDIDVKTLHDDCEGFVYQKFVNFNPWMRTKSYSFYGTIAKNYLMGEKKSFDVKLQSDLDYENNRDEADSREIMEIDIEEVDDKIYQYFQHVIKEVEGQVNKEMLKENPSENDIKVGDAIVDIFKNHELIGAYTKSQVYHLIKEYTNLQTKDITYSLSRFKVFYRLLKQEFIKKDET